MTERQMGPTERAVIKMLYPSSINLARLTGDAAQAEHLEAELNAVARQEEQEEP